MPVFLLFLPADKLIDQAGLHTFHPHDALCPKALSDLRAGAVAEEGTDIETLTQSPKTAD